MQLGRAALQLAGTVCNFAALANLPLAEVRGIIFSAPLLITFFAALLLGEKVALRNWIALFAGFLGVLMIIRPEAVGSSWAALLAVGAAVCISLYQLLTRRFSDSETPLSSLFFTSLAGAVVMSLVMPVVWVAPTAAHWILMLLLGACGAAGHFALIQAFKFERISAITPYSYTQLIWTALLGFIVFNEFPDAWAIGGMAVIAGCGLYIAIDRRLYRKVSTTIVK
jgi:drug/metabolite transporter (DMT)-like permease